MKRPDTRTEILRLAESHIRKKGYNSFSYHEIAASLGVKNAAIHYHFPTKEVLGLEVIRENIRRFQSFRQRIVHLPVNEQLNEFINTYSENCSEGKVCLAGAISVEYFGLPENMTGVMKGLTVLVSDWLTTLLIRGKEGGIFSFKQKPQQKALMIITNLAAGIQLARFMGKDAYDEIVKGIKSDLSPEQ